MFQICNFLFFSFRVGPRAIARYTDDKCACHNSFGLEISAFVAANLQGRLRNPIDVIDLPKFSVTSPDLEFTVAKWHKCIEFPFNLGAVIGRLCCPNMPTLNGSTLTFFQSFCDLIEVVST